MTATATSTYSPDALASLRDSFALHLAATKAPKTSVIYLGALDSLLRHLLANGMPSSQTAHAQRGIGAGPSGPTPGS
jgi:hypothetical protein